MPKFIFIFLLAFTLSAPVQAKHVAPGEAAWVALGALPDATRVRAWFGRRAVITKFDGEQWHAVAAIPVTQPPGEYLIRYRAEGGDNQREQFRAFTVGTPQPFARVNDLRLPDADDDDAKWWWRDAEVLRRTAATNDAREPQLQFAAPVDARLLFTFNAHTVDNAPLASTIGVAYSLNAESTVTAPASAVVARTLRAPGCGGGLILAHGGGLFSILCGIGAPGKTVGSGAQLAQGDTIALLQPPAVVHWSVRMNGTWINPLSLIAE